LFWGRWEASRLLRRSDRSILSGRGEEFIRKVGAKGSGRRVATAEPPKRETSGRTRGELRERGTKTALTLSTGAERGPAIDLAKKRPDAKKKDPSPKDNTAAAQGKLHREGETQVPGGGMVKVSKATITERKTRKK